MIHKLINNQVVGCKSPKPGRYRNLKFQPDIYFQGKIESEDEPIINKESSLKKAGFRCYR